MSGLLRQKSTLADQGQESHRDHTTQQISLKRFIGEKSERKATSEQGQEIWGKRETKTEIDKQKDTETDR